MIHYTTDFRRRPICGARRGASKTRVRRIVTCPSCLRQIGEPMPANDNRPEENA